MYLAETLPKRARRQRIIDFLNENSIDYVVHFLEIANYGAECVFQFCVEIPDQTDAAFVRLALSDLSWI